MKSVGEILRLSTDFLEQKATLRPKLSVEYLLAHLLKLKRLELYMQHDRPLEEGELNAFRELLKRRAKGEPIEYLIGEVEFYGCTLKITPDVLIPRPETEILLDLVCKRIVPKPGQVALDLCTGSGCLAIGLKKRFPELRVVGTDLSEKALQVARQNAAANDVEVEFRQGDLLEAVKGEKFDYLLCNPPYLSDHDFQTISREVRDFEPKMALVGGKTGLEFYEKLSCELPAYLQEGAMLFFEIGASQSCDGVALFSRFLENACVERDWAGHPRFLLAVMAARHADATDN